MAVVYEKVLNFHDLRIKYVKMRIAEKLNKYPPETNLFLFKMILFFLLLKLSFMIIYELISVKQKIQNP